MSDQGKGWLRTFFGPSREEIWRQLADRISAQYVAKKWSGGKVVARVEPWEITLDVFCIGGDSSQSFTRMRAPFVNPSAFKFKIYRKNIFSAIGKTFGMQDIEISVREFDEAFIIKSNQPDNVRQLLSNTRLRGLIVQQPSIYMEVKDDDGWFGKFFPAGVDELYFHAPGVITELPRLQQLYELFAEMLETLCQIRAASSKDPGVHL
jgi:hypothetical protein